MEIKEFFDEEFGPKRPVAQIARLAGVSRNTVYKVAENPENSSLRIIRSICEALGYKLVISLVKEEK